MLENIHACNLCESYLDLGVRPVLQVSRQAKVLIIGQAPGRKVHETGIPFNDPSGDRLRDWMGIDKSTFYDVNQIGIMPMGFCFPGTAQKGGDLPPRQECAPKWHNLLLAQMPHIQLTLIIGAYAIDRYVPKAGQKKTLTQTVQEWNLNSAEGSLEADPRLGRLKPLPHPSPRNNLWLRKNPWYESDVLPELKQLVLSALN